MKLKQYFGSRFRAGSYSVAAAAVVIAMAILVNMIFGTLPTTVTQWDLTANAIYSLSDQTKRVAASVDKDVTFYIICNEGNEDDIIQRLLNRYADLNSRFKVQPIDPNVHPTFLNQYELDISTLYENSVLVVCGEKSRLVGYDEIFVTDYSMDYYSYSYTTTTSFNGENALTNALHFVTSDELPKVYTLTGHGEEALESSVTSALAQDNFEVEELSLLSAETVPEDASALIIHQPAGDINEDEAALLVDYLASGGSIVLLTTYAEPEAFPNLLKVTQSMGLTLGNGIIIEGDRNMRLSRYPHYLLPSIASHDVSQALIDGRYFVLSPIAQPIEETGEGTAEITQLLTTSDAAYAKLAGLTMTTTEQEEGDVAGPFCIGAVAEDAGKLLWITGDSFLSSYIDSAVSGANSNLFLNTLNWMGGQEENISIRAKSLDATGLTLTSGESTRWSVIMIGLIPTALMVVGVVIWVRRKRR